RRRALLLRRTVPDHRLAGDEPRLAVVRAGAGNGSRDRKRIVTIDGCGVPSSRLKAADLILRRRKRGRPVDGNSVVVEQNDQPTEPEVAASVIASWLTPSIRQPSPAMT